MQTRFFLIVLFSVLIFSGVSVSTGAVDWNLDAVGNVIVDVDGNQVRYPVKTAIPCAPGDALDFGYELSEPIMIKLKKSSQWEPLTKRPLPWCVCVSEDYVENQRKCRKWKGPGCSHD